MTLYVLTVLLNLTLLLMWWKGTDHFRLWVSPEEYVVFFTAMIFCLFPVLNVFTGLFLLWHILKRSGRV